MCIVQNKFIFQYTQSSFYSWDIVVLHGTTKEIYLIEFIKNIQKIAASYKAVKYATDTYKSRLLKLS